MKKVVQMPLEIYENPDYSMLLKKLMEDKMFRQTFFSQSNQLQHDRRDSSEYCSLKKTSFDERTLLCCSVGY